MENNLPHIPSPLAQPARLAGPSFGGWRLFQATKGVKSEAFYIAPVGMPLGLIVV